MTAVRYLGHAWRYSLTVNGRRYVWTGHGSVVAVEDADVDELLARRTKPRGCCGGSPAEPAPMFDRPTITTSET